MNEIYHQKPGNDMKTTFRINALYRIIGIGLVCLMLSGCSTYNRIYSENDIVYSTKRYELKYSYRDLNRRSPLQFFTQSIVKEIDRNNEVSYRAYDVLFLSNSSFRIEEKAILIIDDKPFPMVIDKMEFENTKSISENTASIQTVDSTTVSVVTGFTESYRKITRFSYKIPVSTAMEIRKADRLSIRYYAGPSMITIKPRKRSFNKIKELIDRR